MRRSLVLLFAGLLLSLPARGQEIRPFDRLHYEPPAADNGELLIDFVDDEPEGEIAERMSRFGVIGSHFSMFSSEERWVRVRNASSALLDFLRKDGEVEVVEPNYYMTALSTPNDPYYKYQWHLDQIGMPSAWGYPAGAPVIVAVVDTGIAYEKHESRFRVEDLGESQFVKPYNFVSGSEHANDDHGHGTHVAGTIAQLTNNSVGVAGVASSAVRLMPLKVLNESGYGTISDIAAAIRYAADNGAQVINMSLGGPFPSRILHKAVQYAHSRGVVIVCAAGNNGRSGLSYPAAFPECISVSAVRYDGTITWYSSYGKGVTIAAPGGDTRVDQNGDGLMDGVLQNTLNPQDHSAQGYFLFQGTSMAAPHVAASAALLVSHGVTDPERVREYLVESASPSRERAPEKYGAGILNVANALNSAFLRRKIRLAAVAFVIVLALLATLNRGRQRSEKVPANALAFLGLLLGSTGFFFFGFLPGAGASFLLSHSVLEWPLGLLGPGLYANPVSLSFLPALLVALLLYPWKRMASFSVAFCAACGVFLAAQALAPTTGVSWIPGRLLEGAWLLANSAVCVALAAAAAFRYR
jgi:serine protease